MYDYSSVLNLIGKSEGTDKGRGYNETLGYGAYTNGNVNLVGMTLKEIDTLQTKMLNHPKNKLNSSALGRYQIVRTTLRKLKSELGLKDTELFNPALQDKLARTLLYYRGIDSYLQGKIREDTLINNLAREWASLPTTAGKSYYGGQHASVTVQEVRDALRKIHKLIEDDVPSTLPTKPQPSFWQWMFSILTKKK